MSGSDDGAVRVWNAVFGECLHIFKGHTGVVRSVSFSGDGKLIASGSGDRTVRVWNTSNVNRHNSLLNNSLLKDEMCVICMDDFSKKSIREHGYVVKLKCGHYFHSFCIKKWQNSGETQSDKPYEEGVTFLQSGYQMQGKACPMCRKIAKTMFPDGILRLRF